MARQSQEAFDDIHRLIERGDRIGVRTWLSEGGDANLCNKFGWSLLMLAALHGRTDVAEDLLGAGADAHVTNAFGDTAVSLACLKGFAPTAAAIVRAMGRDGV